MTATVTKTLIALSLLSVSFAVPLNNGRIVGGQTVEPGQFPFVVSIMFNIGGIGSPYGGGTIISNKWVLTAASNFEFFPIEDFYILANTTTIDSGGINFSIDSLVPHPEFNNFTLTNDIALIKIQGEFPADQIIEIDEVEVNETCTVMGWGTTSSTNFPNDLQYVDLSSLSDDDCEAFSKQGEFTYVPVPSEVCALASTGVAPCVGDAGGPLVCHDKLVGVLSFFLQMCAHGLSDVYSRASYYKEWIDSVINE